MSREIKLRAWDGENFWYFASDVGVFYLHFGGEQSSFDDPLEFSEVVEKGWQIKEWSGLNDKNGVEIYDGDICSYVHNGEGNYFKPVFFEDGMFLLRDNENCDAYLCGYQELFVVGNIHQNPELLSPNG